jgi:hypothetical protein
MPQAPQLFASFWVSTQLPVQSIPDLQAQAPLVHV